MKNILRIFVVLAVLSSCGENRTKESTSNDEGTTNRSTEVAEGFNLLQNACFSCHHPNEALENKIAPSMGMIKRHYVGENATLAHFTRDFKRFLKNPTAKNVKIPNAIEKYGVMPKMNFNEEEIRKMALYIYQSEMEKPEWYKAHYEQEKSKHSAIASKELSPLELGKNIAMKTKGTLGKNLKSALKSKGTEGALSFCSTRAIPLTDSMAIALNATVKRVSDKNRNPKNAANSSEMAFINYAKGQLSNDQEIVPQLISMDEGHIAYYPIISNEMCLQCHGQPEQDITPKVLTKLNQLYPDDKATGYTSNELRGIWVIEMDAK